ncbi:MAG: hypothetical protein Q9162_003777 [Coniocarpon cinnabarinum]
MGLPIFSHAEHTHGNQLTVDRRSLMVPMSPSIRDSAEVSSSLPPDPSAQRTLILTGSTGNLGSHVLDNVLHDPTIRKVYCLNRSANARERQFQNQAARGFSTAPLNDKVEFITADFGAPNFGLSQDVYDKLRQEADVVLHNAWPVDFNRSFQSFASSIDGVKSLINFATPDVPNSTNARSRISTTTRRSLSRTRKPKSASPPSSSHSSNDDKRIRLLFISSIGVASAWSSSAPTSRAKIPEEELTEWKIARTGYGQSKLVCERLLAHASRSIGIPTSIVRVGQLAGPVTEPSRSRSFWPRQEWFPSMILSCRALGALPSDLGPAESVDWVPVDTCAEVISDLVTELASRSSSPEPVPSAKRDETARFFHITNPRPVTYSSLLPTLSSYFPPSMRVIKFTEWVERLADRRDDIRNVPAGKLYDWFDNLRDKSIRFPDARSPVYETKGTVAASLSLRDLQAVASDWMDIWMLQWGFEKKTMRFEAR